MNGKGGEGVEGIHMGVHKTLCSVCVCDIAQALVCVLVCGVIGGGMLVNDIHIVKRVLLQGF